MIRYNRIILIILDSVGCGVQKDYKKYHTQKTNTLLNIYKNYPHFRLPNLEKLGLKKILFNKTDTNLPFCAGIMKEKTVGNDTLAGVWEMLGVIFKQRFRSKTHGLSRAELKWLESGVKSKFICNEFISGMAALNKYYELHIQTKKPILYFDRDGVALIAAHKKIIGTNELNALGKRAAKILIDKKIARVITRPFTGVLGKFLRLKGGYYTCDLKNFFKKTVLPDIKKSGVEIFTTKHIKSLLGRPSIIKSIDNSNKHHRILNSILTRIERCKKDSLIIFCLREFDTYGHYKNVIGYGQKLIEFDNFLPIIMNKLDKKDLLIITADHGCDPTINMRGHTREHVPLIIYTPLNQKQLWLGTRQSFADIGQTMARNYGLKRTKNGVAIQELFNDIC